MSAIIDDKSEHCIPFILDRIKAHRALHGENARPFFLGLNGVQGAGKTTLVRMQSTRHRASHWQLLTALIPHAGHHPLQHAPFPAILAPHRRPQHRRPLPDPRRPNLPRLDRPDQPAHPAPRRAQHSRPRPRPVRLRIAPAQTADQDSRLRQVALRGRRRSCAGRDVGGGQRSRAAAHRGRRLRGLVRRLPRAAGRRAGGALGRCEEARGCRRELRRPASAPRASSPALRERQAARV